MQSSEVLGRFFLNERYFSGVYCIDVKLNYNGLPIITEINYNRYFTTSNFFATIGMNTPYDQYNYIVNGVDPPLHPLDSQAGLCWVRGMDCEPILLDVKENDYE